MNQVEFMMFFLIGHFLAEFMFQTEHTITNKWKSSADGYATCLFHANVYTFIVTFFLILFAGVHVTWQLYFLIFIPHFIIDKYMLAVHYLVHIKKILAPLTVKMCCDLAKEPEKTPEQTQEFVANWQENLKLDEDTFLGSIFYVIEFYAVDHLMHIVPTFFLLKYYLGF